jgi:hypothetical protein
MSMMKQIVVGAMMFGVGLMAGLAARSEPVVEAQTAPAARVFELRTYTAPEGKLDALKARFRDHTIKLFDRHDMKSIAYFTPADAPNKSNTIIYILAHPSREAAQKNWDAFRKDPDWVKAKGDSEAQGPIVSKVESVYMDATDFSPIK